MHVRILLAALVAALIALPACNKAKDTGSDTPPPTPTPAPGPGQPGQTGGQFDSSLPPRPSPGVPLARTDRRSALLAENNLKQIGIAFHAFYDANNKLPAGHADTTGKVGLSWRVAILPYIEEGPLYKLFKLDEPWDSEHNKKLIEMMPKVYAPIRVKAKAGETFYQTMTGPGTLFEKHAPRFTIANIPDGTSNTGLVYEAGSPVVWTKPQDMLFDAKKPLPKLGGLFDGDFYVCMGDGSVRLIKKTADEQQLKYLIMADDGMVLDEKGLDK
jgi:hypothetical protein